MVTAIGDGALDPAVVSSPTVLSSDRTVGFERHYRSEYEGMVRLAVLLLRSREPAEEAVHDAFAKVYERWPKLTNPGGYLRTCVVNRCRDLGRGVDSNAIGRSPPSRAPSSSPSSSSMRWRAYRSIGASRWSCDSTTG